MFLIPAQPGKLVNRPAVKQKMVETGGEDAWLIMMPNFRRFRDLADGKIVEPDKY